MTKNLYDAEHPYRQTAVNIIEEIFEPYLSDEYHDEKGVEGETYYKLEDKLVELLTRNKNIKIKT